MNSKSYSSYDIKISRKKSVKKQNVSIWLKSHVLSFAFVAGKFIPNPDFIYPYS